MSRLERYLQRQAQGRAQRREAWQQLGMVLLGGVVALAGVVFGVLIRR